MTMQDRVQATMKQISELLPNRKPGETVRMLRPSPRNAGEMQSFEGLLDACGNVYGFGNKRIGTLEDCTLDVEFIAKRNAAEAKDAESRNRFNKAQANWETKESLHESEGAEGLDPAALASRAYRQSR